MALKGGTPRCSVHRLPSRYQSYFVLAAPAHVRHDRRLTPAVLDLALAPSWHAHSTMRVAPETVAAMLRPLAVRRHSPRPSFASIRIETECVTGEMLVVDDVLHLDDPERHALEPCLGPEKKPAFGVDRKPVLVSTRTE